MSNGPTDIERVREATDLVSLVGEHVPLRQRGREHVGLCPFHDDHSPSMAVVTHKGNGFYKCHSCGAAGDAFNFVMEYHKKDFAEALTFLADRAGITLSKRSDEPRRRDGAPTRADLRAANAFAARLFERTLRDGQRGAAAVERLAGRGIDEAMIGHFGLGLAPDGYSGLLDSLSSTNTKNSNTKGTNPRTIQIAFAAGLLKQRTDGGYYDTFRNRLIFPICDELGQPIAFGARAIEADDQPKYLNSPESAIFSKSKTLYGLHLARRPIIEARQVVVTEGYTDVIACHQAGVTNTVATLGTALTGDHARILSKLCDTVVLVFDGDEAGQRAGDRALEVFFSEPVDIRICTLPDGQDPDTLLRADGGIETFKKCLAESQDALTHKVDRFSVILRAETTVTGREKALASFLTELSNMGFASMQGVRKQWVYGRLSELLSVPVRDIEQMMPRRRPRPYSNTRIDSTRADSTRADSTRTESTGTRSYDGSDGSLSPSDDAAMHDNLPGVSFSRLNRARRLAEREVLALLVYDPHLGTQPIGQDDGQTVPAHTLLTVDTFQDPSARVVAEFALDRVRTGTAFAMPDLLHAMTQDEHRTVASDLYFEGRRVADTWGETETPGAFAASIGALMNCIRNDRYRHAASRTALRTAEAGSEVELLSDLLEQRRQCGDIPTAITVESRR